MGAFGRIKTAAEGLIAGNPPFFDALPTSFDTYEARAALRACDTPYSIAVRELAFGIQQTESPETYTDFTFSPFPILYARRNEDLPHAQLLSTDPLLIPQHTKTNTRRRPTWLEVDLNYKRVIFDVRSAIETGPLTVLDVLHVIPPSVANFGLTAQEATLHEPPVETSETDPTLTFLTIKPQNAKEIIESISKLTRAFVNRCESIGSTRIRRDGQRDYYFTDPLARDEIFTDNPNEIRDLERRFEQRIGSIRKSYAYWWLRQKTDSLAVIDTLARIAAYQCIQGVPPDLKNTVTTNFESYPIAYHHLVVREDAKLHHLLAPNKP